MWVDLSVNQMLYAVSTYEYTNGRSLIYNVSVDFDWMGPCGLEKSYTVNILTWIQICKLRISPNFQPSFEDVGQSTKDGESSEVIYKSVVSANNVC